MSDNNIFSDYLETSAHTGKWVTVRSSSLWMLGPFLALPWAPLESRECCGPWTHLVVSQCVRVKKKRVHESVAFNISLIWSQFLQRFLHYTTQWAPTHTRSYSTRRLHRSKYIISLSSLNRVGFCPRLHMGVCKHTYGFLCVCLTVWRMFWIYGPRLYQTSIFLCRASEQKGMTCLCYSSLDLCWFNCVPVTCFWNICDVDFSVCLIFVCLGNVSLMLQSLKGLT